MKFSKLSQLFLVSTIGLILATYLSACNIVTIDYVFVAASASNTAGSDGQIYTYAADAETGALRQGPPTVSSGGTSPVAMAVSSDFYNLYVANQGNNSVVHFGIASNGTLTKKDTITTSTEPIGLAVNKAGTYLYVITGASSATLTEYSLSSGTIGSATATMPLTVPGYGGDTMVSTAVSVLPNNNAVYVSAFDQSAYNPGGTVTSNANPGWLFGFAVGSGGALTPTANSPYEAGVKPDSVACDPTDRFVYATDFASNELIGYAVQNGSSLNFLVNGPFRTGNQPTGVVVDPRGIYIYVSDSLDSSVTGYNISLPTGTPSAIVNSTSSLVYATDTQPVSIAVDPALGRFVYTANRVGNSVSGFRLNPDTGVLTQTQATPYPTGTAPTALVLVPHGNHSTQTVTP
ncbi:MAG TPA: beta-propeller fold lactonase family protein [Terracidiphilus sp.]|jgi:6-phosphogluconolactonase (cycloisomerase 2 family)|nr:beta-propeller fold lactonase family protein [Terracidiphilus sp.]